MYFLEEAVRDLPKMTHTIAFIDWLMSTWTTYACKECNKISQFISQFNKVMSRLTSLFVQDNKQFK